MTLFIINISNIIRFKLESMSQPFPVDTEIDLTQNEVSQLLMERDLFNSQSQKSDKQFDSTIHIQYYIISTKFLKQWQQLVEAAQKIAAVPGKVRTPQLLNQQLIQYHLKDFDQYQIKKQAQEGVHYKLYNYDVMRLFQKYQGARIPRRGYFRGMEKKIQLYPTKFKFIYMSRKWYDIIKKNPEVEIPVHMSLGYSNQHIYQLAYRLIQFSKRDDRNRPQQYRNRTECRVYFANNFDPVAYAKSLRQQKQKQTQTQSQKSQVTDQNMMRKQNQFLQPPGSEIISHKVIGELSVPNYQQYMLIVQLCQNKWLYKTSADKERCEGCCQFKKITVQCRCKQVKYCSIQCKEKDWRWHSRNCQAQYQEDNLQPKFQIKQNSRQGLVGLSNLGNTCYMNAALQCMIHTKKLTQYFKQKHYIDEINQTNPIGSKGKLIKSYAKFIENALVTEEQVVVPSRLKHTIGKTKQMFSGFQQHDSQEFLLFMLDTLHEDLNRIVNKPYTNGVQNQGRPDEIVAKQSWITYLKRNQSFINDIMGGQYRSEVKCPDCHNISVTFDPYLIFAVPIPSVEAKQINLYYFYSNFKSETYKITLSSKNNLVKQLREDLANKTKSPLQQILFIVSGFNGAVRRVDDLQTVDRLINQKQLNQNGEQKQLFAVQYEVQQLENLENKKFIVFKFTQKSGKTLAFKRLFPLVTKNLTGSIVYDRICQFLLHLWATRSEKLEGTERQKKLNIYKTKVEEQKLFKIYISYGGQKQVKNKLIYQNRDEITRQTNVQQLLIKNNYQVEFQVEFSDNPHYQFNSYKSFGDSLDYGQPKQGSNETYSLQQCLNQMKKSQKLVQGNEVFCTKCEDLKLAEKKMQLYKASQYLIVQLRRFKQIGYEKSKNYAQVKFPINLDLSNHILSPKSPQTYFIGDEQSFVKPKYWGDYNTSAQTNYRLYGVVNHHGSLNGGHYTAFGSHQGKWYKFDDRTVTPVEEDAVVTNAAYLLFYQRV